MNRTIKLVQPKLHNFDLFFHRAKEAFESGCLTNNGPFVQQFEKEVARYLSISTLVVANATLGLQLVLRGLNIKGKVIVPSFTYVATVHAICLAGLEPLFVDIDPDTFTLDPKKVEEAITPDTCALMAVHVFGNPCAIDTLEAIAKKHSLPLIFDAAHAFGSLYKGRRIGQFGTAEVFSTHACKTLISAEGGLISTFDARLHSYLQRARNFGFVNPEDTEFVGTNAKMSELHAIIGLDSFSRIRQAVAKQQEIATWYFRHMKDIPGLRFQKIEEGADSNYFNFSIIVDQQEFGMDRDALAEILAKAGVQSRKYFYLPVHQHQAYKQYSSLALPHTEFIASHVLCLPLHTELTEEDVIYITNIIRQAAGSAPVHTLLPRSSLTPFSTRFPAPPLALTKDNGINFSANNFSNSQKISKVLVTGGAGYVGCVLLKKLLEKGYHVRVLDQLIFGKNPLSEWISHPHLDLCIGHVEDKYMVEKCLENMDAVIHLAGLSNDPSCEINPELTRKSNIEATQVLLETAKQKNIKRFIYASSCSVYGFTNGAVVHEESNLDPITSYAQSKVDCEKVLLSACTDNFVGTCLRKATIYGPSPRMRFDLVINTMTGMGLSEGKIIINGGEQWRPFLHVEDAADCYVFMLEADQQKINGQIFNVGSNGQNLKIIDLAHRIAVSLPLVQVQQSPSPDTRSYRVSFDKINSVGWRAAREIEEGVQGIKKMFDEGQVKDFRDINYFNIKRLITFLNI